MNNLELLTIGDVTMDAFLLPSETDVLCNINSQDCSICFSYGDKIPVKNLDFSVGGNASNNSVGTKRLGVHVGLVTTLGGDLIGNQIVEYLEKEGVDLTYTIQQPMAGTNYSTIITYGGERTIFSYHSPRSYEFPIHLPQVPWVYLTSLGETAIPFLHHVLDWLESNTQIKLAYNPGSVQLRGDQQLLSRIIARTNLL
jgi:sugar/nucleoside kinase (ribokinase family)